MADTFNISKKVLNWIQSTVSIGSLPEKEQRLFELWLTGQTGATFSQIQTFSKKTRIPFGYFFLTEPPEESIPLIEYRTVDSLELENPSRDLIDVYESMRSVQDWMVEYLNDEAADDLDFVGIFNPKDGFNSLVAKARELLHIDNDRCLKTDHPSTFNELRDSISKLGVIVMQSGIVGSNTHRPLNIQEFRGFALIDKKAPLIFVNSTDTVNGKCFTLLHEFIHVLLGSNDLYNQNETQTHLVKPAEKLANAVAAELILPQAVFQKSWNSLPSGLKAVGKVSRLASLLGCSQMVVARRALDSKLITKYDYGQIASFNKHRFEESKKRKKSGGNQQNNISSRLDKHFLMSLNEAVQSGKTSYVEAFRLTNTNSKNFQQVVERTLQKL